MRDAKQRRPGDPRFVTVDGLTASGSGSASTRKKFALPRRVGGGIVVGHLESVIFYVYYNGAVRPSFSNREVFTSPRAAHSLSIVAQKTQKHGMAGFLHEAGACLCGTKKRSRKSFQNPGCVWLPWSTESRRLRADNQANVLILSHAQC